MKEMEIEYIKHSVILAIHKLQDLRHYEVASLSGATWVSDASDLMDAVQNKLEEIQLALYSNSEFDDSMVNEWLGSVGYCASSINTRVILKFLEEAGKSIPCSQLPEAIKRISTKPVDLFLLHWLATEMSEILSKLQEYELPYGALLMCRTKNNHADDGDGDGTGIVGTILQPAPMPQQSPVPTIQEMELAGLDALQKSIIQKLLDPSIPQRLEIAIKDQIFVSMSSYCPLHHNNRALKLAQNIYQSIAEENHFDVCFWLFHMFHPMCHFRKMLTKLEPGNSLDAYNEEHLISRICKSLKAKRYLVVVEDNWSYDVVRKALPDENNGSRVLIPIPCQLDTFPISKLSTSCNC